MVSQGWNEGAGTITLLVPWQTEVDIPARDQDHVVSQVFLLDLGLLHDDNVSVEDIEHGLEAQSVRARRIA